MLETMVSIRSITLKWNWLCVPCQAEYTKQLKESTKTQTFRRAEVDHSCSHSILWPLLASWLIGKETNLHPTLHPHHILPDNRKNPSRWRHCSPRMWFWNLETVLTIHLTGISCGYRCINCRKRGLSLSWLIEFFLILLRHPLFYSRTTTSFLMA